MDRNLTGFCFVSIKISLLALTKHPTMVLRARRLRTQHSSHSCLLCASQGGQWVKVPAIGTVVSPLACASRPQSRTLVEASSTGLLWCSYWVTGFRAIPMNREKHVSHFYLLLQFWKPHFGAMITLNSCPQCKSINWKQFVARLLTKTLSVNQKLQSTKVVCRFLSKLLRTLRLFELI